MSTLVRLTPEAFAQASPRAMEIHGLKLGELEIAPTPAEVVTQFLDTFGADFYFCGWNICFDTQFLRVLFDQAGRLRDFDTFSYHRLDLWGLLQLAWWRGLVKARPDSLSIACGLFGIPRSSVHDAMEDARITALILRKSLLLLIAEQNEGNMGHSGAVSKSGDEKPPATPIASLEGTLDLRYLLVGWRAVAHNGTEGHYDAQRRFNRRGRWLGGFATLLTTLTGAAVIKQVSTAIPDPKINAVMAILAAIAVVLTALHTYLAYEARAANHRSTAAGYAAALRKIDEAIIFGYASASEAQKASDEIRLSLDALSRDAPEVPKDILEKYARRVDNPPPAVAARPTPGAA